MNHQPEQMNPDFEDIMDQAYGYQMDEPRLLY